MTKVRVDRRTPEYMAWQNMIQRCTNPKFPQYADYGGRGITVYQNWVGRGGFHRFLAEVGQRPSDEYTLDRRDNSLGYQPGNIRWATRTTQNRNTTKNVSLTVDGITKTLAEWSATTGIGHSTLRFRVGAGWTAEAVVKTPVRRIRSGHGQP